MNWEEKLRAIAQRNNNSLEGNNISENRVQEEVKKFTFTIFEKFNFAKGILEAGNIHV